MAQTLDDGRTSQVAQTIVPQVNLNQLHGCGQQLGGELPVCRREVLPGESERGGLAHDNIAHS